MVNNMEEKEYAEVIMEDEEAQQMPIIIDKLESFACADRIARYVREGKLVFARIGQFRNINIAEFKRTVSKLKTVCTAIDGDIVGVGEDWLIIAPSLAKIERGMAS